MKRPDQPVEGAVLVAVAVFVLSALPVDPDRVSGVERAVFRWVNQAPEIPYAVAWLFMQAGNVGAPFAAAAIAFIRRRRRLALVLPLIGVGTWLIAKGVKELAGRGRPAELIPDAITRHAPDSGLGWVSGHAAVAATLLACAWAALAPRWRIGLVVGLVPLYVAKVYAGEHLPLDMVGGAALGLVMGRAAAWAARARWGADWHAPVATVRRLTVVQSR